MNTDRTQAVEYGQGSVGMECVICLANDYNGTLVHRSGCDELWSYVQSVRDGRGFTPRVREVTRVVTVGRPGEGPNSAGLGYEGQGGS